MPHFSRQSVWLALVFAVIAASFANAQEKQNLTIGFAQVGSESAWRAASTDSIVNEAKKRGVDLALENVEYDQKKEIAALEFFIFKHPSVIVFSPTTTVGWDDVLKKTKEAGIPVIAMDRRVDTKDDSLVTTVIASDFKEEGRRAGRWLVDASKAQANVAELAGSAGSAPAVDRAAGFREAIAKSPNVKIMLSGVGEFTQTTGKKVMAEWLKTPEGKKIEYVFAHNDDMAIGAIQAIEEAGLTPGNAIKVISIDGGKSAFDALVKGKLSCTVECSPCYGPQLFDVAEKIAKGQKVDKFIAVQESGYALKPAAGDAPKVEGMIYLTPEEAGKMAKDRQY